MNRQSTDLVTVYERAMALQAQGDFAAAEKLYRAISQAAPRFAGTHQNLAVLLRRAGRYDEAEAAYRRAIELDPDHRPTRTDLGLMLLTLGRYAEGWPLYESRLDPAARPALSYPSWQGEDLTGRSIIVWYEQGLGDQIFFARFIAPLKARAAQVSLVCAPELARLFSQLDVTIIPATGQARIPRHDYWVMAGSLPGRLGFDPTVEPFQPFLSAPASPAGTGGTGVVWRGNPNYAYDAQRSLDEPTGQSLLETLPGAISLAPEDTGAQDFADTAAIVAGLDRVVCVDTAVAHLAASMGKPTWILLSSISTDWRWGSDAETTPWYPTARLFRQAAPGEWAGTLGTVTTSQFTAIE